MEKQCLGGLGLSYRGSLHIRMMFLVWSEDIRDIDRFCRALLLLRALELECSWCIGFIMTTSLQRKLSGRLAIQLYNCLRVHCPPIV